MSAAPQQEIRWAPFPGKQADFMARTEREVFGGGAGGGGKTTLLLHGLDYQLEQEEIRYRRGEISRSRCWGIFFRRTTPRFKQALERADEIFHQLDPQVQLNKTDHTFTFPMAAGAKMQFAPMEGERDYAGFLGTEYTYIAFDELCEFEKTQYDWLSSRLRTPDPVLAPMCQIRSASNPTGRGFLWVKRKFVSPVPPGEVLCRRIRLRDGRVKERRQVFIPFFLHDNPAFGDGEYEATLIDQPLHIQRAILMGDWSAAEGAMLGDLWDPAFHVVEDHELPLGVNYSRSCDWGLGGGGSPCSVTWWYTDSDNCTTAFHQLYIRKPNDVAKTAAMIKEVERRYNLWDEDAHCSMIRSGPIDPSAFNRSSTGGPSVADEFRRRGIPWRRGNNDRMNGLAQLMLRLTMRVGPAPKVGELDARKPGIRWMRRCKAAIETIPTLPRSDTDKDDVNTKAEDHAYDDARYHCMSRPIAPPRERVVDDDDDEAGGGDFFDELAAARSRRGGLCNGGW